VVKKGEKTWKELELLGMAKPLRPRIPLFRKALDEAIEGSRIVNGRQKKAKTKAKTQ
jgi:hypothetical protein